jgi:hypothetical protein
MRRSWLFVAAWLLTGAHAVAQAQPAAPLPAVDAVDMDIKFWTAAQQGQGAAGYRSYLMLFPDGKFAALAKLRAGDRTPPPDPLSPYRLTASPYVAPHGTPTRITCTGMGEAALFDYLVVVPSGAAEFDPATSRGASLYITLPHIDPCGGQGMQLPAMLPGSYEARYISRSSTPDGSLHVLARAGFLSQ